MNHPSNQGNGVGPHFWGPANWLRALLATIVVLFLLQSATPAAYQGTYPYQVTATTGMVGDIVRRVAGDRAQVTDLIRSGVDPHLYKPSREDVVLLSRADAVFYSGLLLEGQMTDILVRLARTKPVFAVTELIPADQLILHDGHPDPHVWMDVAKWTLAVEAVARSLAEFDPANGEQYKEDAAVYTEELRKLDEYARMAIASIPENQRILVTAHDAFHYLGSRYGIEVMGIQGMSTESEAGLQDINRLVEMLVARKIPAIFVETSVSDKNVRALIEGAAARGHKVVVGGELFSDAMGAAGTYRGTYIGMLDHNVTVIANAMGGTAPASGFQGKLTAEGASE